MPALRRRPVASLRPDPDRELAELREYLGVDFDLAKLQGHELGMVREWEAAASEAELYRTSQSYLYDLTVFAMSGTKIPYQQVIADALPPGSRLIDVGCGIGADGLALLEAGYDVTFADFANPSTAFLRWRLEHRGLKATIHDLDAGPLPAGHDLAYSFDVIEHVEHPFAFLETLEAAATQVLVNFLEPEPDETPLHHELPVGALLDHVATRRLSEHRLLHGRSHLVRYGPAPASAAERLAGRLRRRFPR